ncbi:E-selectin-like [Sycon ciliatum]|uniref:E-selectin-like n=1 Tax=Sycon ciliatum TaxID=27933 RepID=UPI0031F6062E
MSCLGAAEAIHVVVLLSEFLDTFFTAILIDKWMLQVNRLAEVASNQPHAAYEVFVKGLMSKWRHHLLVLSCPANLLDRLDAAITTKLLPALSGHSCLDELPLRKLLSLPARFGGMAIPVPSVEAKKEFSASRLIVAPVASCTRPPAPPTSTNETTQTDQLNEATALSRLEAGPLSKCSHLTVDNGDVPSGSGNLNNIHSVTCTSGFELMGNSIVICLDDGNWSSIPECVQSVECSSLTVANGQVSQGQNTVGSVRTLSCDDGYEPKSDRTIVCLVNGTWSSNPTCQEITCTPALTSPTNGTIASSSNVVGGATYFTCDSGFTLVGTSASVCTTSGSWSQPVPTCQQIYASAPSSAPSTAGPIAEAHQPSTMLAAGAVGLGIGSVAMAIPFIIVLLCIRRSMAYNGKKQHPTTEPKEIINMTSNTAYGDVMISNPESVYEQINA